MSNYSLAGRGAYVIARPDNSMAADDRRSEMATMRGTELRHRQIPAASASGSQDDSARDFAFAQQIQHLVGFSKRPLNHMAAYLPGGRHGEYFPQVLPSTDG